MTTTSTPTAVLVHGAFADASGFGGVIRELQSAGHTALAPPNPLRSLAFDSAAIAAFVAAIGGPPLLVRDPYGGAGHPPRPPPGHPSPPPLCPPAVRPAP